MIAAYDAAIAQGIGAVTFEGKMIDVPVVERAKELLAPSGAVCGPATQLTRHRRNTGIPARGE